MTDKSSTSCESDQTPSTSRGHSYSWLIPIATIVVVVGAVIVGLVVFDEPTPIDTIPDSPEQLRPAPELYRTYCANCHGADGRGVPNRFPPLVDTRWVLEDDARLILITLHGMIGPMEVRGERYDEFMPPFSHRLADEELAAVLTYVRTSWENDGDEIDTEQVRRVREEYPQPRDPWTAEALEQRDTAEYPIPGRK